MRKHIVERKLENLGDQYRNAIKDPSQRYALAKETIQYRYCGNGRRAPRLLGASDLISPQELATFIFVLCRLLGDGTVFRFRRWPCGHRRRGTATSAGARHLRKCLEGSAPPRRLTSRRRRFLQRARSRRRRSPRLLRQQQQHLYLKLFPLRHRRQQRRTYSSACVYLIVAFGKVVRTSITALNWLRSFVRYALSHLLSHRSVAAVMFWLLQLVRTRLDAMR